MEAPRMALAPSLLLLAVPSRVSMAWSTPTWSYGSRPARTGAMCFWTFSTACRTPLPPYLFLSPSRSSTASWAPVLAPLGTMALPSVPSLRTASTSTVGLPRLSRTSRARTVRMVADISELVRRCTDRFAASRKRTPHRNHGEGYAAGAEMQGTPAGGRGVPATPATGVPAEWEVPRPREVGGQRGSVWSGNGRGHPAGRLTVTRP